MLLAISCTDDKCTYHVQGTSLALSGVTITEACKCVATILQCLDLAAIALPLARMPDQFIHVAGNDRKSMTATARKLQMALRKSGNLRQRVLSAKVSASALVHMSHQDLATKVGSRDLHNANSLEPRGLSR